MKGAIIANGEVKDLNFLKESLADADYIICSDGGLEFCKALNIRPDVIAGDFDSVQAETLMEYEKMGVDIYRYPVRKDQTDMEIAIGIARDKGVSELLILGALGKRADHTIGNIGNMLLALNEEMKPVIADELQRIYMINDKIELMGKAGTIVSLIPVGMEAEGVTTEGLEYPLSCETLSLGHSRGISNVFAGKRATVSVEKGILLIIVNTP